MAEKRRFYDVWIVEANTVYREVPFDVVADWVQQGRLLEDDMLRPSGKKDWFRLGDVVDFAVYVPKPAAADTQPPSPVEPMEPVETGFSWRRRSESEEVEVDLIPLIDVSLVLLVFFMILTLGSEAGAGGPGIRTPPAEYASVVSAPDDVWVGIDLEGADRHPVYSCGVGNKPAAKDDGKLMTQADLLGRLQALIASKPVVDLTINANPDVKSGDVRQLTVELEKEPFRSKIKHKYTGVSDKQP
jgi:biopolymer transport protein ExbD